MIDRWSILNESSSDHFKVKTTTTNIENCTAPKPQHMVQKPNPKVVSVSPWYILGSHPTGHVGSYCHDVWCCIESKSNKLLNLCVSFTHRPTDSETCRPAASSTNRCVSAGGGNTYTREANIIHVIYFCHHLLRLIPCETPSVDDHRIDRGWFVANAECDAFASGMQLLCCTNSDNLSENYENL